MFWRKADYRWKEYTSVLEHFRAYFPGEVKRQFRSLIGVDDGESPGSITYTCDQSTFLKKSVYQIAVTRVREYFGSPEDFLRTAIDEMMKTLQDPKIQSLEFTAFNQRPAVEFKVLIKNHYQLRGMTVLTGNALYVLTVFSSPNVEAHYDIFADAFRIV